MDAGLGYRHLDYVLRDHDDPRRPLAPSRRTVLRTTKTLYDGLTGIDSAHPDLPPDGYGLATDDLVQTAAGLVFDQAVVQSLVGLLDGTTVYTTNAPAGLNLDIPDDLAGVLAYVPRPQTTPPSAVLQVTGILTPEASAKAKTLSALPAWSAAIDRAAAQPRRFFTESLRALFDDPEDAAQKLLAGDSNPPLDPNTPTPATGAPPTGTAPRKRLYFLRAFLPQLRPGWRTRSLLKPFVGRAGLAADVADALLSEILPGRREQAARDRCPARPPTGRAARWPAGAATSWPRSGLLHIRHHRQRYPAPGAHAGRSPAAGAASARGSVQRLEQRPHHLEVGHSVCPGPPRAASGTAAMADRSPHQPRRSPARRCCRATRQTAWTRSSGQPRQGSDHRLGTGPERRRMHLRAAARKGLPAASTSTSSR
ncbi:hypothetical protein ACRAWF_07855 [Streptomyces sp. L7]